MKIVELTNNADPYGGAHNEATYLDIRCLPFGMI